MNKQMKEYLRRHDLMVQTGVAGKKANSAIARLSGTKHPKWIMAAIMDMANRVDEAVLELRLHRDEMRKP